MAVMAASPSSRRRDEGLRRPTARSGPDANTTSKLIGSPTEGTTSRDARSLTPGRAAATTAINHAEQLEAAHSKTAIWSAVQNVRKLVRELVNSPVISVTSS